MTTITRPRMSQRIAAFSDESTVATGSMPSELANYAASFRSMYERVQSERPSYWRVSFAPRISVIGSVSKTLRRVNEQLNDALALPRNWDSYGGRPASPKAAESALTWLLGLDQPDLPVPSVVPGSDGSIQLEWHMGGIDLEVLFSPGGLTEFAFEDHRTSETVECEHVSGTGANQALRHFVERIIDRKRRENAIA